jgi:hypothetical protein
MIVVITTVTPTSVIKIIYFFKDSNSQKNIHLVYSK